MFEVYSYQSGVGVHDDREELHNLMYNENVVGLHVVYKIVFITLYYIPGNQLILIVSFVLFEAFISVVQGLKSISILLPKYA